MLASSPPARSAKAWPSPVLYGEYLVLYGIPEADSYRRQVEPVANITTLLVALILYAVGTGPVKGFAVTLSIGIMTSMFTAIMGTRALVNLVYGGRNIKTLSIGWGGTGQ